MRPPPCQTNPQPTDAPTSVMGRAVLLSLATLSTCLLLPPVLSAHREPQFQRKGTQNDAKQRSSPSTASEVHFMRKLLHRFGQSAAAAGDSAIGYAPTVGVSNCTFEGSKGTQESGLTFELNPLAPFETMTHAELHLYVHGPLASDSLAQLVPTKRRKLHGKARGGMAPKSLAVEQTLCGGDVPVVESGEMALANGKGPPHSRAWAVYDAGGQLQRGPGGEGQQRELSIRFLRNGRPLNSDQLSSFVRIHRPFLVLYTTDSGFRQKDSITPRRTKREVRATLTNYGREEEIRRHIESVRKTAEYYAYGMARGGSGADGGNAGIPTWQGMDREGKGWKMLSRRRKMKSRRGRKTPSKAGFDPNDPMLGFGKPNSPWDRDSGRRLLQSPNAGNSLNDIRALREHSYRVGGEGSGGKSGREDTTSKGSEEGADTKVVLLTGGEGKDGEQKCSLHNMTVDFRELGWADRIIAPKHFSAGFCAGQCSYPLEQDSNPSNHAILQSLMAQRGVGNGPPQVCCAPDKWDSVTLLYFDERDNVVLKSYPRMVALSCACL